MGKPAVSPEQFSTFGDLLKYLRRREELTQRELAIQVGYSDTQISRIEQNQRVPDAATLTALFFPALHIEREAEWAARLLELARQARLGDLPEAEAADKPLTPNNLPASLTTFIGREKEQAEIIQLIRIHRLVTLIGPPGIGKTRLSIESARASLSDFPDGVFFIGLAPVDNTLLIAPAIAQSLGYVGVTNIPTNEQLKEGISDKHMLLVIDNCEHLIEDVSLLASELLSACSCLKILATSRESFRVSGEWLYPVPAFDFPAKSASIDMETASNFPALTLFAERARAVRPDFVLNTENIKTISAICARLDGLPLVIELIAARMRLMSPQALLERLNDQFILTAGGMRAASARQKTLNSAINWSYNLLSEEEQKLFAYLSVFSGGFKLDEADSILSRSFTGKSIPDLVTSLLDKSLLQRVSDGEDQGVIRYAMLVTIQEFARNHLRGMGKEAEIRNAHLAYFHNLAEQGGKEMRGPNQAEWVNRLNAMRDNLRAALDWAVETEQTESALQMARKLHWFWFVHSDHNEARHSLGRVLALSDAHLYPGPYAEALTQLAHHIRTQIGSKEARPLVEQALSIARARDDKQNIARALSILGLVLIEERNFGEAQSNLEESKALFREVHDEWEYAHTVISLALGAYKQDDLTTSLTLHEQALVLFRKVGDLYFQCWALLFVGIVQVRQGGVKHGMAALREALVLAQQLDSKYGIAGVLDRFREAAQLAGDFARSVRLNWAAKNILNSIGAWMERDESKFENDLAACRTALSESEFATAMEQGRGLTMEQAIVYAMDDQRH